MENANNQDFTIGQKPAEKVKGSENDTSVLETDGEPYVDEYSSERTPILVKEKNSSNNSESLTGSHENGTGYVYALTFFAALGGFLFGYDTGVISGAMLLLKDVFDLSSLWQELIVSVTVGGAIVGAIVGGWATDKFGRKPVLLAAAFIFTGGALIMGASCKKVVLLIGRVVVGLGIGLASMTVPVYIAEAAPSNIRGTLVTVNQLFITFGQFCASVIDGFFSTNKRDGWRYMLGLAAVPSLIMWIGFLFMPESPRWLVKNGKISEARRVLVRSRGTVHVEKELDNIISSCNRDKLKESGSSSFETYKRVLKTYYTRRALIVGCGLQAIQQLCGINTVMYYSATIIAMAGVHDQSQAIWLAAAVAAANFFFTLLSLRFVETVGRRKLTLMSLAGVILGLALIAFMFYVMKIESLGVGTTLTKDECSTFRTCYDCVNDIRCGFCYSSQAKSNSSCLLVNKTISEGRPLPCSSPSAWVMGGCPNKYSWLAPVAMIFYLAMFATGMGPMAWAINAEIYPLWARSVGNSSSTATNWFFNLLISLTFLHLLEYLTRPGTFLLYTCISLVSWIFLYLLLPESKGKSLEEVEDLFKGSPLVPFRKNT